MERFWLHRYAVLLAVCTLFLVVAGASVTSKEAGLSVPDWPLSYGQVMPQMTGGVFFEHGHRMVATAVGFLTIILAVWLARVHVSSPTATAGVTATGRVGNMRFTCCRAIVFTRWIAFFGSRRLALK